MIEDALEETASRSGFLKKLGGLFAVGMGMAAVPGLARGSVDAIWCCPNYDVCSPRILCSGGTHNYYYCQTVNCCVCWNNGGQCGYAPGVPSC